MKDLGSLAIVLGFIGVAVLGGAFGFRWIRLESNKYFKPKEEQLRTDVFRNNASFIEGTITRLYDLQSQYLGAKTEEHREALRSLIVMESRKLTSENLQKYPDLVRFINRVKPRNVATNPFRIPKENQ